MSQDRRDWRLALSRTFLLSCLWLAYVYALIRSLEELPLIDCVVLICTSPCYLYIFSWIILHKRFLASRDKVNKAFGFRYLMWCFLLSNCN
ncbi:unnamed protein product [Dibothriocephalus latus]|uniref:Uncharacterized protein n=1 Tax=Dibothriocephalus latus TaxID=60516 RepID=A0A3P7LEE2_DIBLA|nr:unnamed protein product [Dibothriocephalus latus]